MKTKFFSLIPFINLLRKFGLDISTPESILAQKIFNSNFSNQEIRLHNALKSALVRNASDIENFDKCFDIFFHGQNFDNNSDSIGVSDNNIDQNSNTTFENISSESGEGVELNTIGDNHDPDVQINYDPRSGSLSSGIRQITNFNIKPDNWKIFATEFIRWTEKNIQFVSHSISFDNNIKQKMVNDKFIDLLKTINKNDGQNIAKNYLIYEQNLKIALKQARDMRNDLKLQNGFLLFKLFQERLEEFLRNTRTQLINEKLVAFQDFSQLISFRQSKEEDFDLLRSDFSKINRNIEEIKFELLKLGKKLATREKRRQRTFNKGKIDFRKTFRSNLSYGGTFLDIKMKAKKLDTPQIYLLLDVSMSMSWIAEFFFLISYAGQLIWNLNLFEFNNTCVEVTHILKSKNLNEAYIQRRKAWKNTIRPRIGHSNYETSLEDFNELVSNKLNKKSRIIILGDCRDYLGYWRSSGWENSRFGEPESKYWIKKFVDSTKEVLILNPEPESMWNTGDSICNYYSKAGAKIRHVFNLESLIKFIFNY